MRRQGSGAGHPQDQCMHGLAGTRRPGCLQLWPALPIAFLTSFLIFLAVFPLWLPRRFLAVRNVFLA